MRNSLHGRQTEILEYTTDDGERVYRLIRWQEENSREICWELYQVFDPHKPEDGCYEMLARGVAGVEDGMPIGADSVARLVNDK